MANSYLGLEKFDEALVAAEEAFRRQVDYMTSVTCLGTLACPLPTPASTSALPLAFFACGGPRLALAAALALVILRLPLLPAVQLTLLRHIHVSAWA